MTEEGALAGLRILDASQMLAGPLYGMRLGDLGADVLKIEPPGTGEWTRTHGFADAEIKSQTTEPRELLHYDDDRLAALRAARAI